MSGSSAPHLGAAFLAALRRQSEIESHFVLSDGARRSIELEMRVDPAEVERLADVVYDAADTDAVIGTGAFPALGMVIIPCSMRTLATVASADLGNLVSRTATATLAAGRRLVLVTRETPLSYIHLRNMATVATAGATVLPPIPPFPPESPPIPTLLNSLCTQVLDQFSLKLGG
jgi:polyprenyl P-hydroxybenzoate/phenylacrylic acid decarboxylase-like protein